jgi:hypothetical protein
VKAEVTQTEKANTRPNRKPSKKGDPVDVLVFLIPCLQFVQVKVIGILNGADVMILAVFLYFAYRGKIRIATPAGKGFVVLCSLWLASQCVTDIVRHTAFEDYSRGWSAIGFTLMGFVVLYMLLYGQPRRLVLYGWGLVTGTVLTYFISPNRFAAESPWKFGLAFPVNLAVFLFVSSEKCRGYWRITLSAILGVIDIFMGTRSLGGVCLVAAFYFLVTLFLRGKGAESRKLKTGSIVALAASILLGVAGIAWAYQYSATAGILGEDAREKYEQQSKGDYGILIGGRPDLLGAIPAIYDSPILGHGSWVKGWIYLLAEQQALTLMGYDAFALTHEAVENGLMPAHSYLLQAWIWAGVLGALFWAWVFVLTARILMRVYPPTAALLPLASFMAFSLLWDILFSPYGATERVVFPYYFVTLMTCWGMAPLKATRAATGMAKRKSMPR